MVSQKFIDNKLARLNKQVILYNKNIKRVKDLRSIIEKKSSKNKNVDRETKLIEKKKDINKKKLVQIKNLKKYFRQTPERKKHYSNFFKSLKKQTEPQKYKTPAQLKNQKRNVKKQPKRPTYKNPFVEQQMKFYDLYARQSVKSSKNAAIKMTYVIKKAYHNIKGEILTHPSGEKVPPYGPKLYDGDTKGLEDDSVIVTIHNGMMVLDKEEETIISIVDSKGNISINNILAVLAYILNAKLISDYGYKGHFRYVLQLKNYSFEDSTKIRQEAVNIINRRVKAFIPIKYIGAKADDLNIPKEDGMCLVEGLYNFYKKSIKTLSIKKIIQIINAGRYIERKTLDISLKEAVRKYEFKNTLKENKEYYVSDVKHFSDYYKISRHGFDILNNKFDKKIYDSNYVPIVYYIMDEHIYFVKDNKKRISLAKKGANTQLSKTIIKKIAEKESEEIEEYEVAHLNFEGWFKFINKIVKDEQSRNDSNITHYIIKDTQNVAFGAQILFTNHNIAPEICYNGKHVKLFKTNNYVIHADANPGFDTKDIENVCKLFDIPFKNQAITKIAQTILQETNCSKTGNVKRVYLTKQQKKSIYKKQKNKCNMCKKIKPFEFDHIVPISQGGTNHLLNFQGLCKECHTVKTNAQINDDIFDTNYTKSSLNSETKKIFSIKKGGHVYKLLGDDVFDECKKTKFVGGIDMSKCRRNILKHNKYNYPIYSTLDEPQPFSGKISCGFYFVETTNTLPMKGNGWYSTPIVEYCINHNIIQLSNIKFELLPGHTLPNNYFDSFYHCIMSKYDSKYDKIFKAMFNMLIGSFGKKVVQTGKLSFVKSDVEAAYLALTYNKKTFKKNLRMNKNDIFEYYEIAESNTVVLNDNYCTFYNQILDIEACELHYMSTIIEKFNGICCYFNTDQVNGFFDNKNDVKELRKYINNFYWDDEKTIKKYTFEDKDTLHKQKRELPFSNMKWELPNKNWNVITDTGFKGEEETKKYAEDLIKMDKSFNINSRAGTGKTTLLNTIMNCLKEQDKTFKTMAPTNIAASHIKGESLHHFFLHNYCKSTPSFHNLNYIIVDEISMAVEMFYRFMRSVKENNPNVKFIICGDFGQLPPVNDIKNYNYKDSLTLFQLCDGNRVQLDICRRADDKLFNLCKTLEIKNSNIGKSKDCLIHICFTNKKRKELNSVVINRVISKNKIKQTYQMNANKNNKYTQDMKIFRTMKVISTKNNKQLEIINSDRFTIKKIDDIGKKIKLQSDINKEIVKELTFEQFNYIFVPAYAFTCHKAQGCTFDKKYCIHQWERFTDKMKYVALSRASDIKYINIV